MRLIAMSFFILMALSLAMPATAVIGEDDDANVYPFVGKMAYQPRENGPWYVDPGGSATLVSPRIAVTAAHVIGPPPAGPIFFFGFHPHAMGVVFHARPIEISSEPDLETVADFPLGFILREISESHVHRATPFVHPGFDSVTSGSGRIRNDLGVLVFDGLVSDLTATIAPEQSAGELLRQVRAHGGKITLVGYGAGEFRIPSFDLGDGRRRVADLTVRHVTNAELWAWKADESDGGAAPGDSGSPAFLKGTSVVVGVLSTFSVESQIVSGFNRVGGTSACGFLAEFLEDLSCA